MTMFSFCLRDQRHKTPHTPAEHSTHSTLPTKYKAKHTHQQHNTRGNTHLQENTHDIENTTYATQRWPPQRSGKNKLIVAVRDKNA